MPMTRRGVLGGALGAGAVLISETALAADAPKVCCRARRNPTSST